MELVGRALEYREEDGYLRVVFRCTNKEELNLRQPPAVKRIPEDTVVRAWTARVPHDDGTLSRDSVLLHWEEL